MHVKIGYTGLFAFIACVAFDANFATFLVGFICLLLDAEWARLLSY